MRTRITESQLFMGIGLTLLSIGLALWMTGCAGKPLPTISENVSCESLYSDRASEKKGISNKSGRDSEFGPQKLAYMRELRNHRRLLRAIEAAIAERCEGGGETPEETGKTGPERS